MEESAFMQLHVADDQLPADLAAKPRLRRVLDLLEHVIQVARSAIRSLRPSNRNWQDLERAFLQSCEELAVQQEISQIGDLSNRSRSADQCRPALPRKRNRS